MAQVGYAIIGCGSRIRGLARLLKFSRKVRLLGGWDPIRENAQMLLDKCGGGKNYDSMEDLLSDPDVSWVLVGSPNAFHAEQVIAALKAGKHVFAEKPLATTIEDCQRIVEVHRESGLQFATGFTLRYATIYRRAKELLSGGHLGRVLSVAASENITPQHGTYIFTNWRRRKALSGPHILEKCVHDLDLLNWLTDSVPVTISAAGGKGFFIPENRDLQEKYPKSFTLPRWGTLAKHYEPGTDNPFLSDSDIEDHVSALMTYRNGVKATFQATVSNALPERRMYFHCTEGNMIIELYSGILTYKSLGMKRRRKKRFIGGGHGDGDLRIMRELVETMTVGTEPVCGGREGLNSAVVAAGIENARESGEIVDLRAVWEQMGA